MRRRWAGAFLLTIIGAAACASSGGAGASQGADQTAGSTKLDVNDVSFLFPRAMTQTDFDGLLGVNAVGHDGPLISRDTFLQAIETQGASRGEKPDGPSSRGERPITTRR
jgi:hypothetical protein